MSRIEDELNRTPDAETQGEQVIDEAAMRQATDVAAATVPTDSYGTSSATDSKKKGAFMAVGGAIAAIGVLIGTQIAGDNDSGPGRTVVEAAPNTNTDSLDGNPTDITVETTPIQLTPVVPPERLTSPEQLPDAPIYPISDNPQMLLNILLHNQNGWRNTGEEVYLENFIGATDPNDLADALREERQGVANYQSSYPSYRESTIGTVLEYDFFDPNRREIVFSAVMSAEFEERERYTSRFDLIPKVVNLPDGTEEIGWYVYGSHPVEDAGNS